MYKILINLFVITLLLISLNAHSQIDSNKVNITNNHIEVHGFIKSDVWVDSRQIVLSREGLFALFPADIKLDALGNDLNAVPNFNFAAMSTRASLKFKNYSAFNATASAFIEADFTGASNATVNTFRLRHAYLKLNWTKSELLMGQYWHPMFVVEAFPLVLSLNTGSPFQPFIRNPQFTYTYKFSKSTQFIISAIAQRDNATSGPIGNSYTYISNTLIQNLHAQVKWNISKTIFGFGYDAKWIKPRTQTDSNLICDEKLFSNSILGYVNYKSNNFEFRSKLIYGQNMSEHLLLGGYAVSQIDTSNDFRIYTPTQHLFCWAFASYKINTKKLQIVPNLFIGYAKNLGTIAPTTQIFYGLGNNINELYRATFGLNIGSGPVQFAFELEDTYANYGTIQNTGRVLPERWVNNLRTSVSAIFLF